METIQRDDDATRRLLFENSGREKEIFRDSNDELGSGGHPPL